MAERIEFYDYTGMQRRLDTKLLQNPRITKRNKQFVLDFMQWQESRGISKARRYKNAFLLTKIVDMADKDLDKATMRDIEQVVIKINSMKNELTGKEASSWYRCDARTALKLVLKFIQGDRYNPKAFEWLRTSLKSNEKKSRVEEGTILSVDEIEAMIRVDQSVRNKALISVAYESAARPSEPLSLRLANVMFDKVGAVISIVQSKTKLRSIRLIGFAPYLKAWINVRPHRDQSDSPVWIANKNRLGKPAVLVPRTYYKILMIDAKKAGINKAVYPYLLRHSRITHLAQRYPDQIVKRISGHTPTSEHYSVYLHISNKDVDDAILKAHGLQGDEQSDSKELEQPVHCWNCGCFNSIDAKYCVECNFSLDLSNLAGAMAELKKVTPFLRTLAKLQRLEDEQLLRIKRRENFSVMVRGKRKGVSTEWS